MEGTIPKPSILISPPYLFLIEIFGWGRVGYLPLIQFRISITEVKTLRKIVREFLKTGRNAHFEKIKRDQTEGILSLKEERNTY